jgi:hypothetical protein
MRYRQSRLHTTNIGLFPKSAIDFPAVMWGVLIITVTPTPLIITRVVVGYLGTGWEKTGVGVGTLTPGAVNKIRLP